MQSVPSLTFGSVCSGIEAASEAWHELGWRAAFFSQFDPEHDYKNGQDFPSAVLAERWPGVPNLGDMTKYKEWPDAAVDVLVGGTPCQSFSVAGLRGGLDDERGNLMLVYACVARKYRPQWVVWENVPGVLSSEGGRDFASLLGVLSGRDVVAPPGGWRNSGIVPGVESGYGLAWRVLDAQYFGVPQRRRRVFVVGCLGNWRGAAAVLLERASLRGDPPPRRSPRKGPTAGAKDGARAGGGEEVAGTLTGGGGTERSHGKRSGGDRHIVASPPAGDFIWRGGDQANSEHVENGAGTLNCDKGQQGGIVVSPITGQTAKGGMSGQEPEHLVTGYVAETAPTLCGAGNRTGGDRPPGSQVETADSLIVFDPTQVTSPDNRSRVEPGAPAPALGVDARPPTIAFQANLGTHGGGVEEDVSTTVKSTQGPPAIAFSSKDHGNDAALEVSPVMLSGGYSFPTPPAAVAVQLNGDRRDPGVSVSEETAFTLPANPMSDRGQAVAFKASHYTRDKDGAPAQVAPPLSADADKGDQDTLIATNWDQQRARVHDPEGVAPTIQSGGPETGNIIPAVAVMTGDTNSKSETTSPALCAEQLTRVTDTSPVVFETRFARNGRGAPDDVVPPLKAQSGETGKGDAAPVLCVDMGGGKGQANVSSETAPVLNTSAAGHAVGAPGMKVRRLTPRECERLQGFRDDYTAISFRGKPAADGPRYKALGNSMAVPVMKWIGRRISAVHAILFSKAA